MKVNLRQDSGLSFIGDNGRGHETRFDTTIAAGGQDLGASPVEIVLEAMAACTSMDVIAMLQKARKEILGFNVAIEGERAEEHPRILTKVHMSFALTSPNTTKAEFDRFITLSKEKYCSVSIMIARSGAELTWESVVA